MHTVNILVQSTLNNQHRYIDMNPNDKPPTNAIEQGRKWAEAVHANRPSARTSSHLIDQLPLTLKLTQLGAILTALREQMKDAAKDPFRSGVMAALALVGEHASLQAKENNLQDRMQKQWQLENTVDSLPATAKDFTVSKTSTDSIAESTDCYSVQQQIQQAQQQLYKDIQEQDCAIPQSDYVDKYDAPASDNPTHDFTAGDAAHWKAVATQYQEQIAELQEALKRKEAMLDIYRERNQELEALAKQMHGQDSTST
jgi:hypothetical protein